MSHNIIIVNCTYILMGFATHAFTRTHKIKCYLASRGMNIFIPKIEELEKINLRAIVSLINFAGKLDYSLEEAQNSHLRLLEISKLLYSGYGIGVDYCLNDLEKKILSLVGKLHNSHL